MTIEEIAEIEDPSINPFKNYSLADKTDLSELLEAQKVFYQNIHEAYKEEQLANLEMRHPRLTAQEREERLKDPDMSDWS